jgi:hypothetical protein
VTLTHATLFTAWVVLFATQSALATVVKVCLRAEPLLDTAWGKTYIRQDVGKDRWAS